MKKMEWHENQSKEHEQSKMKLSKVTKRTLATRTLNPILKMANEPKTEHQNKDKSSCDNDTEIALVNNS